ncbi:MAG: MBL fold metallo-hydrolase [Succinivibrio sp.]|nr:MBL fold metallo-hydrolase [Succinivibrio sp.]
MNKAHRIDYFITPKSKWIWLPVFSFLIEHPRGLILFDTGWHREMSPHGIYDRKAQIRSLGSLILYLVNHGRIADGEAINELLEAKGIKTEDLDYVLLSHLDSDHANGLRQVSEAKRILVSEAELAGTTRAGLKTRIRFNPSWWKNVNLQTFSWNGNLGPAGKSYDLFGDGSAVMVNIPGHSEGVCALKLSSENGKFVLLYSDGGYGSKSWREMITSGISLNKEQQRKSLEWIREQSLMPECLESIASHDADVRPHTLII